jgi:hypothetical protein
VWCKEEAAEKEEERFGFPGFGYRSSGSDTVRTFGIKHKHGVFRCSSVRRGDEERGTSRKEEHQEKRRRTSRKKEKDKLKSVI